MPAVKPEWTKYWEQPIEDIRLWLNLSSPYFVGQGIGGPDGTWCSYARKLNGSLRRVTSPHLPERDTKEEAERDLYAWLWGMASK